jgi:hypothetical protein
LARRSRGSSGTIDSSCFGGQLKSGDYGGADGAAVHARNGVENGVLPGYIVPGPPGQRGDPGDDFLRLMKQVEALMQLVTGNPVGVRAA